MSLRWSPSHSTSLRAALAAAALSALAAACGGVDGSGDKSKLEDDGKEGLERYDEVSAAADPAGWTEVRVVESAHPYANNFRNTWSVSGSAGAQEMRVVFERFELEENYDTVVVANASGDSTTRHTGTLTNREVVVAGERVELRMTTDGSVTGWGFRARIFERRGCACPAVYMPVCGADGRTYSNACAAGCANAAVAAQGECRAAAWVSVPQNPAVESAHPYANNTNRSWTINVPGARQLRLTFSRIDLERNYDFVRLFDATGRRVTEYTGRSTNVVSPTIQGSSVRIQLTSDRSTTGYGFQVSAVEAIGGCASDAECGANEQCAAVTCIAAPCFNVCQARAPQYQTVTVAALEANPAAFDGRAIEVVATPALQTAICTKVACGANNPCCNRCSAGFTIGSGSRSISLARVSGDAFGCSGNECNYESSCTPAIDPRNPGPYTFRGTFQVQSFGGLVLNLDSFTAAGCAPGGCSGETCSNAPGGTASVCVFRPEFACYQQATCAAQADGLCGWTQTPALQQCITAAQTTQPTIVSASGLPAPIPDASTTGVSARLTVAGAAAGRTVRVDVAITHTYRGDLRVVLTAPNRREQVLHANSGGSFDDLVLENVDVSALLSGAAANGVWTLRVTDNARSDVGSLDAFSLRVE